MCVSACIHGRHVRVLWRSEEGTESLGAGVLGSCELSYVGIRILGKKSRHSELPEPSLQLSFTSFQKRIHFVESSGKNMSEIESSWEGHQRSLVQHPRCGMGTNCHWSLEGIVQNEVSHVERLYLMGTWQWLGGCSVGLWWRALYTIGQFWGPHAIYGPEQRIPLVCLFKVIMVHVSKTWHMCTGEK